MRFSLLHVCEEQREETPGLRLVFVYLMRRASLAWRRVMTSSGSRQRLQRTSGGLWSVVVCHTLWLTGSDDVVVAAARCTSIRGWEGLT